MWGYLYTHTVHLTTDILAHRRSENTIRVFPAARCDVLNNNGSGLQLSGDVAGLLRYSTRTEHTLSERKEMTKTDASAAFIISQYAGCVTRPSSCYAVSMFLTAWIRKESKHRVHAILHLLKRRCQTEWTDNLTECWMISLEHLDGGLSRMKEHVFNLAGLIKAATCSFLTSINL